MFFNVKRPFRESFSALITRHTTLEPIKFQQNQTICGWVLATLYMSDLGAVRHLGFDRK